MRTHNLRKSVIESLEARIAPATLVTYPKVVDAEWLPLSLGTPIQLTAGQGLSTLGDKKGNYLLFVEQGSALIFTKDYNGNDIFDSNEITGIAAGDGLRLISFVDIHGDIVTNLKEISITEDRNGTIVTKKILSLSDSDNNPTNDVQGLKGDGRVLLNSSIEKIELRPLIIEDLVDQNDNGIVNQFDLDLRQPPKSTFSVYGSIYAGRNFGADDGGLMFNPTADGRNVPTNFVPMVDSIRVGTAVSGQFYSFGVSGEYRVGTLSIGDDLTGVMSPFLPAAGAIGGSINTVKTLDDSPFNIGMLVAGNGGAGAEGGSIKNVAMRSDDASGYQLIAGTGGTGRTGGNGGSIINFFDAGSFTGLVVLSGGDGGTGTIGNGGNAGSTEFTTLNVKGNVHVDMGSGGNGFVNGGNGASLAKATFTEPATLLTKGLNGWGTTHLPDGSARTYSATLGVTRGLDFNNDGEGDYVFATQDASQLTVMISDPRSDADPEDTVWLTFQTPDGKDVQGIYLNGPRNGKALSAGDVNGDGHPDLVVASQDYGGTGDIMVFLASFEDANNDGIISSDEDKNGTGSGLINPLDPLNKAQDPRFAANDFLGFLQPRHSTVPILGANSFGINDLAIGDFDGDGAAELIVGAGSNAVFMMADKELNPVTGEKEFNGQFYYDYGRKTVNVDGVQYNAELKFPFVPTTVPPQPYSLSDVSPALADNGYNPVVVEATTVTSVGATYDVAMVSAWGASGVLTIDWSTPFRTIPDAAPVLVGLYDLGPVDLNRGLPIVLQPFRLYDFTTVDLDGNGVMDIGAISLDQGTHSGFLNSSIGLGNASGVPGSGTGQNAGNYMELVPGYTTMYTIRAGDADGNGLNDLIVSHELGGLGIVWAPGPDSINIVQNFAGLPPDAEGEQGEDPTNHSFADPIWIDVTQTNPTTIFGWGRSDFGVVGFSNPLVYPSLPYIEYTLSIIAGDGGAGLVGKGGTGGFIGGTATVAGLIDPATGTPITDPITGLPIVNLTGAVTITTTVTTQIESGNGGDGFSVGGNGGSLSGIHMLPSTNTQPNHRLVAGDGGRGVFGIGGAGGSLISNQIWGGVELLAGDGGVGKSGGNGGSVVGSGASYDVYNSSVAVLAGNGGLGTVSGGNGGTISKFHVRIPEFDLNDSQPDALPPLGSGSQFLFLQAGDGGSAVTGKGGNGGSVLDSSPTIGLRLRGELIVYAGDGGRGNTGGDGGGIDKFTIAPDGSSNSYMPSFVTLLAGNGGDAFAGRGGKGGNLSNLNLVARSGDSASTIPIFSAYGLYQDASRFLFNRVIAGEGGSSAGNEGGAGGSVSNLVAFTPFGSFAVVGGAGGDGLRKGGVGGSATNLRLDFGASTISKALVAAGAGGDASSFVVNSIDPTLFQNQNMFGGKVGRGGNGGHVDGVTQKGALDPHMDIIAGDGGSTIHFGTVLDKKGYVGVGGSVRNINVAMNLGNNSASVALKSYNDVLNGQSFGEFVQTSLVLEDPLLLPVQLNDSLGNVGVVTGAAGRNKAYVLDPENRPTIYQSVPSKNGTNGALENVFARSLISAVSGSVDRIASIQQYKAVTITNGTGGDKNAKFVTVPGGTPNLVEDFADALGIATTSHEPVLEGINVDGAIVAKKFLNAKGQKVPPPLNGYIR